MHLLYGVYFPTGKPQKYTDLEAMSTKPSRTGLIPPLFEYLHIFRHYSYKGAFCLPDHALPPKAIEREALQDYSALRVLELHTCKTEQMLPAPSNFPSLVTFSVVCPEAPFSQAWSSSFLAFLRGLPRLANLCVIG